MRSRHRAGYYLTLALPDGARQRELVDRARGMLDAALASGDVAQREVKGYAGAAVCWFNGPSWRGLRPLRRALGADGWVSAPA